MFELPWHIDRPILIALVLLVPTGLSLYLRLAFNNEQGRARKVMNFLLSCWTINLPHKKKLSVCRRSLTAVTVIFGLMAAFGFSVGLGIIRNKERKPLTFEDIRRIELEMEAQGLKKRPRPELERTMRERGLIEERDQATKDENRAP